MGNEINMHSNITINSHSRKFKEEHNTIFSQERPFKEFQSIYYFI